MTILTLNNPFLKKRSSTILTKKKSRILSIASLNWSMIFLSLILCFGIGYLILVNSVATKGYQTKSLEKEKKNLEKEQKELELQIFSLKSLERIKQEAEESKMVAIDKIEYLGRKAIALQR